VSNLAEMLVWAIMSIQGRLCFQEETAYPRSEHVQDPLDFEAIALDIGWCDGPGQLHDSPNANAHPGERQRARDGSALEPGETLECGPPSSARCTAGSSGETNSRFPWILL
jgi:hypothetical protein